MMTVDGLRDVTIGYFATAVCRYLSDVCAEDHEYGSQYDHRFCTACMLDGPGLSLSTNMDVYVHATFRRCDSGHHPPRASLRRRSGPSLGR
jgi:hypothetical protein